MLLAQSYFIVLLSMAPGAPARQAPPQTPPQQTTAPKPQEAAPKVDPNIVLPVDLDRIQRALAKTPMLRFDPQDRPIFRVQVFGDKPTLDDILGPDWRDTRPVPHGAMTHQEFLNMVTPVEARGYAGFTNKEGMTVAATSALLQWTMQKAIRKFRETDNEREREAARKEVLDALNALEEARAKAGLPRK